MSANTVFLSGSSIAGLVEMHWRQRPILDEYAEVADLFARGGAPHLLAEPVVARQAANGPTVAWYTGLDGGAQLYAELAPSAQDHARQRLEKLLAGLTATLRGEPGLVGLARALFVPSLRDIYVVNGEPVLVNWGLVPQEAAASPVAQGEHFRMTLGALAPQFPTPPTDQEGEAGFVHALARGLLEAAPAVEPRLVSGRSEIASSPPPAPASLLPPTLVNPPLHPGRPWLAPLVATFIAGAVLIFLLIPGVLIYPAGPVAADDGHQAAAQGRLIAALEEREALLKSLLGGDICPRPETPRPPPGLPAPTPPMP